MAATYPSLSLQLRHVLSDTFVNCDVIKQHVEETDFIRCKVMETDEVDRNARVALEDSINGQDPL